MAQGSEWSHLCFSAGESHSHIYPKGLLWVHPRLASGPEEGPGFCPQGAFVVEVRAPHEYMDYFLVSV